MTHSDALRSGLILAVRDIPEQNRRERIIYKDGKFYCHEMRNGKVERFQAVKAEIITPYILKLDEEGLNEVN